MFSRLDALADRASDWIDAHSGLALVGLSLFYFPTFLFTAYHRRFWFDELFTLYITAQPTVADLLARLMEGMDQQPPPYYLIHRPLLALSGDGDPLLAMRIPAILGVWLGCVCLFWFIQRRTSAVYGLLAVFVLLLTPVGGYAAEARPYGLVVGFTALALLAYQNVIDGRRRPLMLTLLGLALLAGVSSSYYAVLSYVAIAIAETVRICVRRRIDWGVVGALGASTLAVLFYLPFVTANVSDFTDRNWASPYFLAIYYEYVWMLGSLGYPVAVGLVAWVGWRLLSSKAAAPESTGNIWVKPRIDIAAAVGLALLPIVEYLVASAVTNKMTGRYVLQTSLGLTILITFSLYSAASSRKKAGLLCMLLLAFSFLALTTAPALARRLSNAGTTPPSIVALLEGRRADLPVVVDTPMENLVWSHRNWNGIRERLYYLVDPPAAKRVGSDVVKSGGQWLEYQKHMPVRAVKREEFLRLHPEFYLYYEGPFQAYVLAVSMLEGASIKLVARNYHQELFLVKYPSASNAAATGSAP